MAEVILTIDGVSHRLTRKHIDCVRCSLTDFCEKHTKQTCYDLADDHNYSFEEIKETPIDKIDKISEGIDKILKILEK
ncbi:MAG: hypothetical protein MJ209_00245 [archaeon]|nr:hypothetical protein [archaeon]